MGIAPCSRPTSLLSLSTGASALSCSLLSGHLRAMWPLALHLKQVMPASLPPSTGRKCTLFPLFVHPFPLLSLSCSGVWFLCSVYLLPLSSRSCSVSCNRATFLSVTSILLMRLCSDRESRSVPSSLLLSATVFTVLCVSKQKFCALLFPNGHAYRFGECDRVSSRYNFSDLPF